MTGCCQHHWTRAVADVRRWRQAADRIGSGRQYSGTPAHFRRSHGPTTWCLVVPPGRIILPPQHARSPQSGGRFRESSANGSPPTTCARRFRFLIATYFQEAFSPLWCGPLQIYPGEIPFDYGLRGAAEGNSAGKPGEKRTR